MRIKVADNQEDFFRIMRIRTDVFVIEQNVDVSIELDKYDDNAIHIIAYIDNTPIGCARVLLSEDEITVGRFAVLKEYRKMHTGKSIMEFIFTLPEVVKVKKLVLHAQCSAQGFYEKLGFIQTSEIYQEANIDHIMMVKTL